MTLNTPRLYCGHGCPDAIENSVHADDLVSLHLPALEHRAGNNVGADGGPVAEDWKLHLSSNGTVLDQSVCADICDGGGDRDRDGVRVWNELGDLLAIRGGRVR